MISLFLCCIYYDLLFYILQQKYNEHFLNYEMSHKWLPNIIKDEYNTINTNISNSAYMDDTALISLIQENIQTMLNILDSFADLNHILINISKTELLVITQSSKNFNFTYNNMIHILKSIGKKDSIHFLGIWLSINKSQNHII